MSQMRETNLDKVIDKTSEPQQSRDLDCKRSPRYSLLMLACTLFTFDFCYASKKNNLLFDHFLFSFTPETSITYVSQFYCILLLFSPRNHFQQRLAALDLTRFHSEIEFIFRAPGRILKYSVSMVTTSMLYDNTKQSADL